MPPGRKRCEHSCPEDKTCQDTLCTLTKLVERAGMDYVQNTSLATSRSAGTFVIHRATKSHQCGYCNGQSMLLVLVEKVPPPGGARDVNVRRTVKQMMFCCRCGYVTLYNEKTEHPPGHVGTQNFLDYLEKLAAGGAERDAFLRDKLRRLNASEGEAAERLAVVKLERIQLERKLGKTDSTPYRGDLPAL